MFTEGKHVGEYLLSEGNGSFSRDEVTVTLAGTKLVSGTVLGKITIGATATSVARAGNTGTGAMGTVTVSAGAKVGRHTLSIVAVAGNAGTFEVEGPDGVSIGTGTVAVAFAKGGLAFTLADATDFVLGDVIYIDVVAGSGKYVPYVAANTNGSGVAAAILYTELAAATGDVKAVVHLRDCEVRSADLTGNDAAGTAALRALGVLVRV